LSSAIGGAPRTWSIDHSPAIRNWVTTNRKSQLIPLEEDRFKQIFGKPSIETYTAIKVSCHDRDLQESSNDLVSAANQPLSQFDVDTAWPDGHLHDVGRRRAADNE
jgi:hypothetical protein